VNVVLLRNSAPRPVPVTNWPTVSGTPINSTVLNVRSNTRVVPSPSPVNAAAAALETLEPDASDPSTFLDLTRNVFLQALLAGNRRAASGAALEALRDAPSSSDVYIDLLQSALYEVGRLWESNRITVAEEHMATAVAQFVLGEIFPRLPSATERRGAAVVTGVEGEMHQIGAHMVADILQMRGWEARFLGTNAPHPAILQAIESTEAPLAVCGHIHESWGAESQIGPTRVLNLGPSGTPIEV